MALIKRTYIDRETVITAENLNDIQDAIIMLEDGLLTVDDNRSGEVITITDAAKRGFRSFNIYGKTTQDGTPTPEAPVELSSAGNKGNVTVKVMGKNIIPFPYMDYSKTVAGVTFTVNKDGSIAVSGTSTGTVNFWLTGYTFKVKKGVTYTLSLGNDFTCTGDPYFWVAGTNSNIISGINMSKMRTGTFTPTQDEESVGVYLVASTVGSVFNGTIRPQIEVGAKETAYEPYKGKEITIAAPNGLPGIPVTSGGNYTDADGQQWICDEIDLVRGVYIQRVGSKIFDGSEDETWYSENPLSTKAMFRIPIQESVNVGNIVADDFLCTHFATGSVYSIDVEGAQHTGKQFYFRILKTKLTVTSTEDVSGFRAFLADSPMTVSYVLGSPVETSLSAEEQAAYAALHTYKEHTTISNDAMAYMELEYAMDTKKYIDSLAISGGGAVARLSNVTLRASAWTGADSLYSQVVTIYGITPYSKVDLLPSVEQLAIFHNKDVAFVTENEDGTVTVYAIGDKPTNDYTMQVSITEVVA